MVYEQSQATKIGEGNRSCIKLATNSVMHKGSEQNNTKFHFFREKVENDTLELVYTPTAQLAADLMTKTIPQLKMEKRRRMLMGSTQTRPHNSGKT